MRQHGGRFDPQEGKHQQHEDRLFDEGAEQRRELRQHQTEQGADGYGPGSLTAEPFKRLCGKGDGPHGGSRGWGAGTVEQGWTRPARAVVRRPVSASPVIAGKALVRPVDVAHA
ncbi:hypothetical protein GCM10007285_09870 [Stappia taiwanensis]|nr:hypothetical protein GCM10007285_09870 [Stappia taiwanensis]